MENLTDEWAQRLVSRPRVKPEPRPTNEDDEMLKLEQKAHATKMQQQQLERDPLDIQLTTEEDRQRLGFIAAMADKEFYTRDLAGRANRAGRNWVANILGAPSDTIGMLAMLRAADPVTGPAFMQSLGVNSIWDIPGNIPGNSDAWAETLGGDPEEASMIATAFLSPADLAASAGARAPQILGVFGGAGAAERKGGGLLSRLQDFFKREAETVGEGKSRYDDQLFAETGWFRDEAGDVKFHISDAGARIHTTKFEAAIQEKAQAALRVKGKNGYVESTLRFRLYDILDHEDLYDLYPDIANLRIEIPVWVDANGNYKIVSRTSQTEKGSLKTVTAGDWETTPPSVTRMTIGTVEGGSIDNPAVQEELRRIILHETEHTVQMVEGFATGSYAFKGEQVNKMLDDWSLARGAKDVLDSVDSGNLHADDIIEDLIQKGYEPEKATKLYTENQSLVKEYTDTVIDYDQAGAAAIMAGVNATIGRNERELAHILNWLAINEDTTPEMFDQIMKNLEFEDMDALAYAAYRNSLGEAYARLTERLSNTVKLQGSPNPNTLRLVEKGLKDDVPLSVGPKQPPGYVVDHRLADIPIVETTIRSERARMPEGPVFDRPTGEPLPNRSRGGVDGGVMDIPGENDYVPKAPLPEGTQTSGAFKPDYITKSEGMMPEEAVNILMDKNSTGAMREAAQFVLKNEPFKSIPEDELFEIADELGMLDKTPRLAERSMGSIDEAHPGVFGKYYIQARKGERTARDLQKADTSYYNKRRRQWRMDDPDLTEEEIQSFAVTDLKRLQENRESLAGKLPSGEVNRVRVTVVGKEKTIELLKNPTETEFNAWSKRAFKDFYRRPDVEEYDEPMVRIVTDVEGNVYVWDADAAMHSDVIMGTGMKYDYESDWTDVDGIEIKNLFKELVAGGVYSEVGTGKL